MKCAIRWIDEETGRDTPDENEAVCMAVSTIKELDGSGTKVQKFPCCSKHAKQLVDLADRGIVKYEFYYSGWSVEGLPAVYIL